MLDQVVDEPVLGHFHIDMDLRRVFETVSSCWIVPVPLRRTPCDDGHNVVFESEGHQSMRHMGQVLLSFCLHSLTIVDICETWKEQEPSRYTLEEGIQLVHHHIIGLTGIEGPCYEDVVHDRFWFKPVLEGPVSEGLDAEHVL